MMTRDIEDQLRDALNELLVQKESGEITTEEFERRLNINKVVVEMIGLAAELVEREGSSPEDRVQHEQAFLARQQALIALWPEACRRADVPVFDFPLDLMRIFLRVGRPS
jgi:hypothetical protein